MTSGKKKILLVTAGFPFGDWERGFLQEEFDQMYSRFRVSILCVGNREELVHPHPEDVPVRRYFHTLSARKPQGIRVLLRSLFQKPVLADMKAAFRGVSLKKALRRCKQTLFYYAKGICAAEEIEKLHRQERFDLIYTYWCSEMTVAAAILKARCPELKLITRFHGHDLFADRKDTDWQPLRPYIAQKAEALVFACRVGMEYFLDTWGRSFEGKSLLHYLGSADTAMPPKIPSDTLRLVSCSNLIPLKRVDRIIDAIARLPDTLSVRWDHFGDGPERASLEQRARETLGAHVTWKFHGRVPNHTLPDHYRALDPDLFLTASSTEGGAPVSLQEAFCMGIPAVGTAAGGIPELVISGSTGWLISGDGKAEDLAGAILDFAGLSYEDRKTLSVNARQLWERQFNARQNARTFLNMLERLMDKEAGQ